MTQRIEVTRIAVSRIAVCSETDYREAGSVDPVLRFLRTGGGFIHPAPIGLGKLDAREVKASHETPAILRTSTGAPALCAFWLVSHRQDSDVAALPDPPKAPIGAINAIAYSWLFIQAPAIASSVWHQAGAALSRRFNQTVLCRDRNEISLTTFAGSKRTARDHAIAEKTLGAIVANAMPESSQVANQSGFSPLRKQSLYAAVPHCNSSRMMFAYRGIWKGDE